MKVCVNCQNNLPDDQFKKRVLVRSTVLNSYCIACNKERLAKYYKENKERLQSNMKQYYLGNIPKFRQLTAKWKRSNKDKVHASQREYDQKTKAVRAYREATRRFAKRNATPVWANEFFIEEAYSLAELRSKLTNIEWHVDHIVPLKSALVCGLHNEYNLQVIPGKDNLSKGNRFWPDMP